MGFDLSLYETVAQRLVRWWDAYPDGRIITSIHHYDGSTIIMRAECYNNDDKLISTGYAEEQFGSSPVNKTSMIENCETSSIGRAISNSKIGHLGGADSGQRASMEEMAKVNRLTSAPARQDTHGSATPKQIGFLKSLARGKSMDDLKLLEFMQHALQVNDVVVETLTFDQASKVISAMKL
jgi:hypothetical protein